MYDSILLVTNVFTIYFDYYVIMYCKWTIRKLHVLFARINKEHSELQDKICNMIIIKQFANNCPGFDVQFRPFFEKEEK